MVRTVSAAFQRDELRALEEAARTLGANFAQRFLGVLVPAVLPAIVAGCLMVFTLSIGEFNLTWMLHTPLTRTLPVGLADSYASMRLEVGSAYTLVFLAVILPVLWALQALAAPCRNATEPDRQTMQLERTRIEIVDCAKTYADGTRGLQADLADGRAGRGDRAARPFGLRQDDAAAPARRPRSRPTPAAASSSATRTSPRGRSRSAASAWCSRATRCSRR